MSTIQKLELAKDLFPKMISGAKTNTLRWNEGIIEEGFLLFYAENNINLSATVWVNRVTTSSMKNFACKYNMSAKALHSSMLRHYPDIKIDSIVSFIEYLSPEKTLKIHGIPDNL